MLRKAKRLPVMLMLVLITVFLGSLSGCSDSADPLGTGIIQFYDATTGVIITSATADPGGTVTLVVRVRNLRSDGSTLVPVIGEKVTFTLLTPGNGGGLTVVNDRTAGNGQAMAVYTAGNNLFSDAIRATTGAGATAAITITKTGAPRGSVVALSASPSPVAPLGFSTITATVTDSGRVVQGERVNFALLTNNGATLSIQSGFTDGKGQVNTTYQAGNNQNQDVVLASLANGATAQVTITKTSGIRGLVIALAASPPSVAPLGFSTITATVTDNGIVVLGERVTFSLPTTDTEASLSVQSGLTNASGQVITRYQAGNNNKQDVVHASLSNGATAQVIIAKDGVGPGRSIALAANPNPVAPGNFAIVTATVTDSGRDPVSGAQVWFSMATSNGSLSRSDLTTDGNGVATIVYYAWDNMSPDIIEATTEGALASLIITKTGQELGYTATMTANPATFTGTTGSTSWICNSILTVTVVDNNSKPAQGVRVRFNPGSVGGSAPSNALTGIDGKAIGNFIGLLPVGTFVVEAYVDLNDNGVQDPTDPATAVTITVTPP